MKDGQNINVCHINIFIGSGINYSKSGLKELISLINKNEVSKIVVLYKDRLVRFGFELIEYFAKLNSCEIEIVDNTEKTEEQELVEDLIQIVTVFSCRLQGKRAEKHKNINKTGIVKKIKKKLKRLQRKVSRKYEMNKTKMKGGEIRYNKTNNIMKTEKKIKLIHRRLTNIRLNNIHQITTSLVKTKPQSIVIEDLNINGMMKNRHLSKAIQEQCLYTFTNILEYKTKFYGIKLVKADRWYPSSKTCSKCGNIKKDLKLSDRMYKCECGFNIDRDLNAAINLSKLA